MAENHTGSDGNWRYIQAIEREVAAVEGRGKERLKEAEERWRETLEKANALIVALQFELLELKTRSANALAAYDKEAEDNHQIHTTLRIAMYTTIATGLMTAFVIGLAVPFIQGLHATGKVK